jgi:nicotinamide mononucleotide adenylyltransferase
VRDLFKKGGYNVGRKIEIFKKKYNGSHIRKLIIKDDKSWKTLVSKEIANLIISLKGPERIRKS